mmetsp:Transcript_4093/g.7468  ORF Transcript_4093/g.7468 Transcript_4093/m.7468 type:complete len:101 (-) Transcript_4093:800-1102(-)
MSEQSCGSQQSLSELPLKLEAEGWSAKPSPQVCNVHNFSQQSSSDAPIRLPFEAFATHPAPHSCRAQDFLQQVSVLVASFSEAALFLVQPSGHWKTEHFF